MKNVGFYTTREGNQGGTVKVIAYLHVMISTNLDCGLNKN
jgi:hypothetical protein